MMGNDFGQGYMDQQMQYINQQQIHQPNLFDQTIMQMG
jgi:hypothetical protein